MSKNYELVSKEILDGLKEYKEFIIENYFDFEDKILGLKEKIEESKKENRLLKLGIVGEVKSGKSSFLNALLFDGKEILPKASTPMTAALTKISYSENTSAKIIFYSEEDWGIVEKFSKEYDEEYNRFLKKFKKKDSKELREVFNESVSLRLLSCKELTEMFYKYDSELIGYLGKEKELKINDIDKEMKEYVGANGKFTPIVKYVELKINNDDIKDIEIVDTPGINDPIISRGETTKKFLGECDIVFLLSYAGQFLTQNDIEFICEALPNEGIKKAEIVCSKFDSGMLDDNKSKSIKSARNSSISIYSKQAEENIRKIEKNKFNFSLLEKIEDSLPPNFISSILYSCANKIKNNQACSEEEKHILKRLEKQFSDFDKNDFRMLLSLSGINAMRKKIYAIKNEKEVIIEEKNKELLSINKKILSNILEKMKVRTLNNKENLETCDKNELEKKLETLQSKVNSIKKEINNIFKNAEVDAERILNIICTNIDKEINNYQDIEIKENTKIEHHTYRSGFLNLKKNYEKNEIIYYTASVSDVISNIRAYIVRIKEYSNEEFNKVINIEKLEDYIKDVIVGAFDLSQKKFNENDILLPLEIVIKKIKIPKIEIEVSEFESMIISEFSSATVEGNEINKLHLKEIQVLGEVSKKIKEEIDKCQKSINKVMDEQSDTFVENIVNQLKKNIETLEKQLCDKENMIKKYDLLYKKLCEYKKMIDEMEI